MNQIFVLIIRWFFSICAVLYFFIMPLCETAFYSDTAMTQANSMLGGKFGFAAQYREAVFKVGSNR